MNEKKNSCLWKEIAGKLESYIHSDAVAHGDTFYSIDDISKQFHVSSITSRRVLDELEKLQLIERTQGRSAIVRKNAPWQPEKVYILDAYEFLTKPNEFAYLSMALYRGFVEELGARRIESVVIGSRVLEKMDWNEKLDLLICSNYLGLPVGVRYFLNNAPNVNSVCANAIAPIPGVGTVRCDLRLAAAKVVGHLLEQGYRRIATITTHSDEWNQVKFNGYCDALRKYGIPFDGRLARQAEFKREAHYGVLDDLLKSQSPPDAVFCVADKVAGFVYDYCRLNGIRIPETLAVAGFDNLSDTALWNVPLTTIDTNWVEQGRRAVRMLLQRYPKDQVRDELVPSQLTVRKSTQKV